MNPNFAFLLILGGLLLIYGEVIWMGRFIPGIAGSLMTMCGIYFLWRTHPAPYAPILILAAVIAFGIEASFYTYFTMAALATVLLAFGFWQLRVAATLAFPVSVVFGVVTSALLQIAKRARRNKRNLLV